ncbi:uncharacterized protein LOC142501040 isoform X1 [Ascaphus truei]|uniref:uncharacterized protein LOC142501040 isoform X1 n=1 Tax=Ascaphus truei TaxID=8439 RepID=UPI003F5A1C05
MKLQTEEPTHTRRQVPGNRLRASHIFTDLVRREKSRTSLIELEMRANSGLISLVSEDLEAGSMEAMGSPDNPLNLSVPMLSKSDKYHVFISYSSGDSIWVYGLIHKLEETFPSLRICYHERDFLPGKTIIDNMVECIQSSQKTLMVLSPDFVRSRWCLFEANLSMFRNCMGHKAIVPIMLKPCPVPLHLSHLTYLEAIDAQFFEKLAQVLLSKNGQMTHSTLVHYQPSLLYNGKTIHTLPAVNEGGEAWQPGIFSNSSVPDSLRPIVNDPELYKEAIGIINDMPRSSSFLRFITCQVLLCIILGLLALATLMFYMVLTVFYPYNSFLAPQMLIFSPIAMIGLILMPILFIKVLCWKRNRAKVITREMVPKTGQANLLLMKTSVLAGWPSRAQLFFVYVSLHQCMQTFQVAFGRGSALATAMQEKAIVKYSSDYACCLARNHFTFDAAEAPGHLKGGICFCQCDSLTNYLTGKLKWLLTMAHMKKLLQ